MNSTGPSNQQFGTTRLIAVAPDTLVMLADGAPSVEPQARLAVLGDLKARLFAETTLRFGRYEVIETIGRGAFGVVFRATDPELGRDVAVKVLLHTPGTSGSLVSEARSVARLNHPHVVGVHDVGRCNLNDVQEDLAGEGVFIVMELVEGSSLSSWLQIHRPVQEILDTFRQAGEGLAAAHEAGLVHRDFKPANVLVDTRGVAKVADFGLATEVEVSECEPVDPAQDAEKTQYLMGTPLYISPELISGGVATARSDQYAFCVALRGALSGGPVFDARTLQGLWSAKQQDLPEWSDEATVSRRLRQVIDRGMAVDPAERWSDMPALLEAIDEATRPRRAWWLGGVGVALVSVAVVGGVVGAVLSSQSSEDSNLAAAPQDRPDVTEPDEPPSDDVAVPSSDDAAPAVDSSTTAPTPPPDEPLSAETTETEPDLAEEPDDTTKPGKPTVRRPSGRKPAARPPKQRVSDREIRRAVAKSAAHCSRHGGMASVSIGLQLEVEPSGKVSSVTVREPYTNGPIGRCVSKALSRLTLSSALEGRVYTGTLKLSAKDGTPSSG